MQNLESNKCEAVGRKKSGINWAQNRRLEFIDYRLCWTRHLTREDVRNFFGVSAAQVSQDLTEYEVIAPGNFVYDSESKRYRATDSFQPIYASSSTQQHLDDLLRAVVQPDVRARSYLAGQSPVEVAPLPTRKLDAEVVGLVLRSIRSYQSIKVTYRSLDNPEGDEIEVTPHSLTQGGTRWLVRCWCCTRGNFETYDLSRIVRAEHLRPDLDRSGLDKAWERMVSVVFIPHPELTAAQRRLIEDDYGMVDGEMQLKCRRALLSSMLRQLNLHGERCSPSSEFPTLLVKNWEQVQPLLLP